MMMEMPLSPSSVGKCEAFSISGTVVMSAANLLLMLSHPVFRFNVVGADGGMKIML